MDYYKRKTQEFSRLMVKRLEENDDKGGWENCDASWLVVRLREEASELIDAYRKKGDREIIEEAVDVANFAMMIVDVLNGLDEEDCSVCHGQGATTDHHDPCTECDGTGKVGREVK